MTLLAAPFEGYEDRPPSDRDRELERRDREYLALAASAFRRPLPGPLSCDSCGVSLQPADARRRAQDVYFGAAHLPVDVLVLVHCDRCAGPEAF